MSNDETVELNFDVKPDAFMLDQVVVTSSKSEVTRRESLAGERDQQQDIRQGGGLLACRRP